MQPLNHMLQYTQLSHQIILLNTFSILMPTTGILLVGRSGAEEVEMLPSPIAMNIDVDIPLTVGEEVDEQSSHLVIST